MAGRGVEPGAGRRDRRHWCSWTERPWDWTEVKAEGHTEVGGCDTYSGYKNTDYLVTEWMLGLMEREELGWQQDFGAGQLVIY